MYLTAVISPDTSGGESTPKTKTRTAESMRKRIMLRLHHLPISL